MAELIEKPTLCFEMIKGVDKCFCLASTACQSSGSEDLSALVLSGRMGRKVCALMFFYFCVLYQFKSMLPFHENIVRTISWKPNSSFGDHIEKRE